jgi:hypothetical protein
LPDIEKINNVAVASISKLDAVTFAHGQKVNNQDVSLVTDARTLIEAKTFADQSTVSFTSLGGSSYNVHLFQFINIHADSDDVQFRFASDEGNDYQVATFMEFKQNETGTTAGAAQYAADYDTLLNANTNIANIGRALGDDGTESFSGYLTMTGLNNAPFAHTKHWYTSTSMHSEFNWHLHTHASGAIVHDGTSGTDAVTQIDFTMSTGTFDGTIRLFGMALA